MRRFTHHIGARVRFKDFPMIGLVVVTHGQLAVEFLLAAEHVVGPQEQIKAISIGPDDDMEKRRENILDAARAVDSGDGVDYFDRYVWRHAVKFGHCGDGKSQCRSDCRGQFADADQACVYSRVKKSCQRRCARLMRRGANISMWRPGYSRARGMISGDDAA